MSQVQQGRRVLRQVITVPAVRVFCLLCLIAYAAQPSFAVTSAYDVVKDFSKTSNPNGVWSFGWEQSVGDAITLDATEDSGVYAGIDLWEGGQNCGYDSGGQLALRP